MYAVEFETRTINGMIPIPKEYQELDDNQLIKVIVLRKSKKVSKEKEVTLQTLQSSSMGKTWDNKEDEAWDEL
ncbi:hypothetical protein KKC13_12910 [bacterium]|nr:hypothetical protein [bacterium]MBU1958075.1 hypothetical protein [bacterium]